MSVPKCKECEEYYLQSGGLNKSRHMCGHKECVTLRIAKMIMAKDVKTSPKWCPKRKQEV